MENLFQEIIERLTRIEVLVAERTEMDFFDIPMDIDKTSEFICRSKSSIYAMVHRKTIPFHKKDSKLYFYASELNNWIKSK